MNTGIKLAALVLWMTLLGLCVADQKATSSAPVGWDNITPGNVPKGLKLFWNPIITNWTSGYYEGGDSNARAWKATSLYCSKYFQEHRDPTEIHLMIADLSQHPSELRAVIYGMVVVHWNRKEVRPLLKSYSSHGSAAEKIAANDFIADLEEFDQSH